MPYESDPISGRVWHQDIRGVAIQAEADGGARGDADLVAHHEAVQPPRVQRVHHLRGVQAARDQGVLCGLLSAHVGHYIRLHQRQERDGRPPQCLGAVEGDGGGHGPEHDDRRPGEAGEGLRRGRALHADLRRRGVGPGYYGAGAVPPVPRKAGDDVGLQRRPAVRCSGYRQQRPDPGVS